MRGNDVVPDARPMWRHAGSGAAWTELARRPLPVGLVDILWRDPVSKLVEDRIRVAILPPELTVTCRRANPGWDYSFVGAAPLQATAVPSGDLDVTSGPGGGIVLHYRQRPQRRVRVTLGQPGLAPIEVEAVYPVDSGLASWEGRIVPANARLSPGDLGGLVAFAGGRSALCAVLRDRGGSLGLPHRVDFIEETALRQLAERVALDLGAASIDAVADLDFLGGNHRYRVMRFDCDELRPVRGGVQLPAIPLDDGRPLALVGRPVAAPAVERIFLELDGRSACGRPTAGLPDDLAGTWLIYLRSGDSVRCRPYRYEGALPAPASSSGFTSATEISDAARRKAAIRHRLQGVAAGSDDATTDLEWIQALILSLNGLPATTFDVLAELPRFPGVLARLLLSADTRQMPVIWRLERELPFMWAAVPIAAWRAAGAAVEGVVREMLKSLDVDMARRLARETLLGAARRAVDLEPILAWSLAKAGFTERPGTTSTLKEAADDYVRRSLHSQQSGSLFRQGILSGQTLFVEYLDDHHEALDAPVAAALAAAGPQTLTPAEIRRCKLAALTDPAYFNAAYAAVLDMVMAE